MGLRGGVDVPGGQDGNGGVRGVDVPGGGGGGAIPGAIPDVVQGGGGAIPAGGVKPALVRGDIGCAINSGAAAEAPLLKP